MGAAKIPSECLWCERWPVWRYIGVESAQSSFTYIILGSGIKALNLIECLDVKTFRLADLHVVYYNLNTPFLR